MGKTPTVLAVVATASCVALSPTPALAGDTTSSDVAAVDASPANADQNGNPIPQAPDDADVQTPAQPDSCPPDPGYSFTNVKSKFIADPDKIVYGASGVTLTLSVAKGHTWTGAVTNATKVQISAIVAGADDTISASISYAKTTTVTLGGSWTVPANRKDGWLALGSKGYSFHWEYGSYHPICKWTVSRSGNAKLPAMSPYIAHS